MKHDPLDRTPLVRRARAALARLDFEGAIEALFKLEHDDETRILLARAYRNTARPREARKLLEALAEGSPDAATELGMLELALQDHARAHALFTRALVQHDFELHVDAIHGLAYLAELRTRGGDRTEVYALLERGLTRHPNHHVLLQTLGIAHLNDSRVDEAIEIFGQVIAIRADAPWAGTRFEVEAHGNMACALVAAGKTAEALEAVERTMEVCPRWFRQGMAMAMQSDPDLKPIHQHPEFIASMAYRAGGTREERIARAETMLQAKHEAPPPLPDLDRLEADVRSRVGSRVEDACRTIHELVSAREEIWEDHGWCEKRIRTHAEALIERCLRDVSWLRDAALVDPSPACVEVAALLLVSYDAKLSAVGRPLALDLLTRWRSDDPASMAELIDALSWEHWYEERARAVLPESASLLVEVARDHDAPAHVRNTALEALAYQGTAVHAGQIADLVADDDVAATIVEVVHALDPDRVDPEPLLLQPSTRLAVAETYASELFDPCFDELMTLLGELDEPRRDSLLRALMPAADERLVPVVLEHCTREQQTYSCLRWLRSQPLTDAQLEALLAKSFEGKRIGLWLADVVRGQGRLVTVEHVACLPLRGSPDEGTASLVGYANVAARADWLREHIASADKRTLHGIVVGLARVGDASDLSVLERLGERVAFLKTPTLLARVLLGDDLALLEGVVPKTPFAAWALERLFERHGPLPQLVAAVDRATERGLHNEDLSEFRRVIERLRKA